MTTLLFALIGSVIVSLVSLIGIFSLLLGKYTLQKIILILVAFSAGGLMGSAFFHILPEVIQQYDSSFAFVMVIVGFTLFFVMERVIYWRHCHDGVCDEHPFVYLNLIGDSLHNFVDGMVIMAAFAIDMHLGLFTTFTIILHEIPHELGNFGVLVHGGFSVMKAVLFNFLTALFAIGGVLFGFFLIHQIQSISNFLLAFAAGGFLYVAASDLIPELHKEKDIKRSMISFVFFIFGIAVMWMGRLWFT